MSDEYRRFEIITGTARRRRWSTQDKLRMIEETLLPGESISVVARRHGVATNLLYRWRRLPIGGKEALCH
jgi:transposase